MEVIEGGFGKQKDNTGYTLKEGLEHILELIAKGDLDVDSFLILADNSETGSSIFVSSKQDPADIIFSVECLKKMILEDT